VCAGPVTGVDRVGQQLPVIDQVVQVRSWCPAASAGAAERGAARPAADRASRRTPRRQGAAPGTGDDSVAGSWPARAVPGGVEIHGSRPGPGLVLPRVACLKTSTGICVGHSELFEAAEQLRLREYGLQAMPELWRVGTGWPVAVARALWLNAAERPMDSRIAR